MAYQITPFHLTLSDSQGHAAVDKISTLVKYLTGPL